MSVASENKERFARIIKASLAAKTISENGNRSGTATEQLHRQLASELSSCIAADLKNNERFRILFKTEWQIAQDAFGKCFNIDLALFIQRKNPNDTDYQSEQISIYVPSLTGDADANTRYNNALAVYANDNHTPDLLILVKHPLSSYNKNRFNTALTEIGEAARTTRTYTGGPSGYQVILLSFLQSEVPIISRNLVKGFETPDALSTKEVLKLFKDPGNVSRPPTMAHPCTVRYAISPLLMATLKQCHSKNEYFQTLQDAVLNVNMEVVNANTVNYDDLLIVIRGMLDPAFFRPGTTGRRFNGAS